MSETLKVKVLKKTKDAPYPEHIIVERKSSYEMVHLYFDEGLLKRLTHIKRDPTIKMKWNEKEKRYPALLPNYIVQQDIVFKEGKENHLRESEYLKGPCNQRFIAFSVAPPWNLSTIHFYSSPKSYCSALDINMDLNDKCIPNNYIKGCAEIKEIYPHQKRRTCPNLQNFKTYENV